MANITEIIPPQGFEIVKDRLLKVLFEELSNQRILQPELPVFNLYSELGRPLDKSETITVNVLLDNINYDGYGPREAKGDTTFNIDVYAKGESTSQVHGELAASNMTYRFLGLCRYILQSVKTKRLGFSKELVTGTNVRGIQIYDSGREQDASNIKMGRLQFTVKIQENQELWKGEALNGANSEIRLELTEKGYKHKL